MKKLLPLLVAASLVAPFRAAALNPVPLVATSGLSTATTLTKVVTGDATKTTYVWLWRAFSSVACTATADAHFTLKTGTGTNCGTGTAVVDGCFNQTTFTGCGSGTLPVPIIVPPGKDLCWIMSVAGSKWVTVHYTQSL